MSFDPFGGVFINLDLGIPGGNVLLEVRGARRQLRNQDEFIYALEYPKNVHSCAPSDPCVLSWGLDGQFRCSGRQRQTMVPQPIDSVMGHGLLKLLSTRIPAEAGSCVHISRVSFRCWAVHILVGPFFVLVVGFMSVSSISSVLLYFSLCSMLVAGSL